ncbi:MAG: hypothetical protein GOP50_11340 [Candidatus Heimdallarchaeota archaeon]|nr:hypothetical protein [Candidatus Heimdallarchaeota archaeon]
MSVNKDGFFANIFDAYKQTFIMIVMLIAYLIIPAGVAFLGFWLAHGFDVTAFNLQLQAILADPITAIATLHWGYYIMAVAVLMALVSFAAAFIFTASRNDRIGKPVGFFKAFLVAWGILFTFVIVAAVFFGAYYGFTYLGVPLLDTILFWVAVAFGGLSIFAMIFRSVDYLLELE